MDQEFPSSVPTRNSDRTTAEPVALVEAGTVPVATVPGFRPPLLHLRPLALAIAGLGATATFGGTVLIARDNYLSELLGGPLHRGGMFLMLVGFGLFLIDYRLRQGMRRLQREFGATQGKQIGTGPPKTDEPLPLAASSGFPVPRHGMIPASIAGDQVTYGDHAGAYAGQRPLMGPASDNRAADSAWLVERPQSPRGFSLLSLFMLTALCATLAGLVRPVYQKVGSPDLSQQDFIGAIISMAMSMLILGMILGSFDRSPRRGIVWGGLIGMFLGAGLGPIMLLTESQFLQLLTTSVVGSGVILAIAIVARAGRSRREILSKPR